MLTPTRTPDWDIFCAVVDNYGDIGVCWRLARQLAAEHGQTVRLWVDDLKSFKPLCPQIDIHADRQSVYGIEIRLWKNAFPNVFPALNVIEAFACHIPESYIAAMVHCQHAPVWINLEYLSAEAWVTGCHTLSSPHPRLPLTKYFFFPGFSANTGGLLRERDLLMRRREFEQRPELQAEAWRQIGFLHPRADSLCVSLFAYENPAIPPLLKIWEESVTPVCCLVPVSRALGQVEAYCGNALAIGSIMQRGSLEICAIPFVPQADYDQLLWACDLNFVRGEDSFVRAQWAARPMVWHIYPQEEATHIVKLDAFLDAYCAGLPGAAVMAVRNFWRAWNDGAASMEHWNSFAHFLPLLRQHAEQWSTKLSEQEDLSAALVHFCRSKV